MSRLPVRRRCRQCGGTFLAIRHDQVFCKPGCRRKWHAYRETQGTRAVELLIKWRRDRCRGSLAALTAFADELVRDQRDHEAARGSAGGAESAAIEVGRAPVGAGSFPASAGIARFASGRSEARR
jgi:hypothetical protein